MAHGRPWYQRNGGDFVTAVLHFPDNDHRWAYSAIVDLLNDRDRPLADEPGFICGFTSLTKQKWAKVRAYLLHHGYLTLTEDGRLTNPRFEREAAKRDADHARSVEAGRAGGRVSAARRAGQSELQLGENLPTNLQQSDQLSSNKLTNLVSDDVQVSEPDTPKTNDLAEPPPQATCARESASETRDESLEHSTLDSPKQPAPPPDVWSGDLLAVTNSLAKLAGISLHRERTRAEQMDLVKAWRADGIDIAGIVVPVIERDVRDNPDTARWSLLYFDPAVRKAMARKAATGDAKPSGPKRRAIPLRVKDDADPRIAKVRAALKAKTHSLYANWLGPDAVALSINGVGLIVTTTSSFTTNWLKTNMGDALASSAQAVLGSPAVEVRTQ